MMVACVAKKGLIPTHAAELYQSVWFKKARAYAETVTGENWRILSAKHGLVHPTHVIAPYDVSLRGMNLLQRERWACDVLREIRAWLPEGSKITLLAGKMYRVPLVAQLRLWGYQIVEPLAGLGIGEQIAWMGKEATAWKRLEMD